MPDLKLRKHYQELIAEFRPDSGHLLACLHKLQHHYGYVPPDAVPAVAQQLGMTAAAVFGALSFYSEFRTSPLPETLINWCSGPACRFRGGENIRRALEAELGLAMETSTPDNAVGLHLAQCEGSCEMGPLVWLRHFGEHPDRPDAVLVADRGDVVPHLTVAAAVELARRLKSGSDGA
jgi:NADH:ubiquinone oxidoreductase subunit E